MYVVRAIFYWNPWTVDRSVTASTEPQLSRSGDKTVATESGIRSGRTVRRTDVVGRHSRVMGEGSSSRWDCSHPVDHGTTGTRRAEEGKDGPATLLDESSISRSPRGRLDGKRIPNCVRQAEGGDLPLWASFRAALGIGTGSSSERHRQHSPNKDGPVQHTTRKHSAFQLM